MKKNWVRTLCLSAFLCMALYGGTSSAAVLYVKRAATGLGDGSSWTDAYTTIQPAVAAAASGDEVWVAKGWYTATSNPGLTMKQGVAIYGGFAGTELARADRNVTANATIIDGASTYQCVVGASNAALDGFTIQNARNTTGNGTGMYNDACTSLTVANCTFSGNAIAFPYLDPAIDACGGAMYNSGSTLTLTNCTFTNNSAYSQNSNVYGGAIANLSSVLTVTGCVFTGNSLSSAITANVYGGAVYNSYSTLSITQCAFTSNDAVSDSSFCDAGAIYSDHSTPTITNCTFTSNRADGYWLNGEGGALSSVNSSYDVVNCVFAGNSATGYYFGGGGASCSYNGEPRFTHCVFTANTGNNGTDDNGYGGAVYCCGSHPTFTNCILYGDSAKEQNEIYCDTGASATFSYCCVTDKTGTGCIDTDPLFVDGTDGGNGYDLRLRYNSPCINTGTDTSSTLPASASDILGIARPQGTGYDMGAYEYIAPVAAFSASPANGSAPLAVTFTDESTAPSLWPITAWAWTFGDGATSAEQNPEHTFDTVGTYTVSLTVTTSNGSRTAAHSVTVQRGDAPITAWPTATGITYGQALSASSLLDGSTPELGNFGFADPTIVPHAGVYSATLVFTPDDLTTYNPVYHTTSVTVAQVTPTVSPWPTSSGLTYGQALSDASLSGGSASVAGAFAFARPDFKPTAGTYAAAVNFAPTDPVDYASVSGTADVEVAKAAPTITSLPTATAITYGQSLAASLLTGGQAKVGATAVAGTFAFTTPSEVPGSAGAYSASVTFTPADTANYLVASASVSVPVVAVNCPECEATTGPYTVGHNACLVVPGTFSASATFSWARQDSVALDTTRCSGIACQRLQIANLRLADSATYECTYTDGATSDMYSVTIVVSEASSLPATPHGWLFVAVVVLAGLVMTWYYRRSLFAE